ncbi:MAG TPA: DNA polymerase III subunit alpha [Gaiellaceae bacterium]|nr:DNA polymerase III subunit alpha [Gaiellaceae bacterium]
MAAPSKNADFVHLHVHSEYSILDGACRVPDLVARAAELEMPSVSLTDHGSMAGAVQLWKATRNTGVKPVIGCEVYVANDRKAHEKGNAHLTLLAADNTGYSNLIKLSSLGFLEGYYYKPRVDWELLERHKDGLIALSGCLSGRVCKALEENRVTDAEAELDRLTQTFGRDNVYVELQNAHLEVQARILPQLVQLATKVGLPTVATGDVHYLRDTDARAHEALLCIQSGDSLKNPNHWRFETDHFYFKTPQEMALDFPGQEDAMRRTLEVAERCNVEIELDRILLPRFDVPEGRDAFDYLVELCEKGLQKRYDKVTSELQERLRYELKTIKEMGFTDYFLIVWDFIRFAKSNGVPVGPGRGSSAGSLVAYTLAITDIDPIRYDLMFERFLNPGRKSMPDIDIDFAVDGRERVINYVREKYGADRVAQIITFSTMAARAAVRDAGRVLEVPYGVVDKIAKLIPEGPGQTLDECLKPGSELRKAIDADPVAKEIIELAQPLEGLTRADSIHAAGVVIGAEPLINVVPLQQKGADQELVTQFSMKDIEALGLLKMDFLGLRNLDVIDKACQLIGGLDIATIPLDDKKTYAMLAKGDAAGVFQFESSGMRDALRQVKPTVFEDLIALGALYRPGPMANIPSYGKRKAGQEAVTYIDKRLEPILKETYGICLAGDTLVFDAASGRRVRIDSLEHCDDVLVQGVDEELRPAHARITRWFDNGIRPVYTLKLRNGAEIRATGNHEFLTEAGWRTLDSLKAGDYLATPKKLTTTGSRRSAPHERARHRALAYLLADGSLSGASPSFYSSDPWLLIDFEQSCTAGFGELSLARHAQVRGVVRIVPTKSKRIAARYHDPSPLEEWLRELDLRWRLSDPRAKGTLRRGPASAEKWIPEQIFELPEAEIAEFLATLWECDGHVSGRVALYKTISKRLADDVQSLLLRLGIRSSIWQSRYAAGDGSGRIAYQVTVHGAKRFGALVQEHMVGRKGDVAIHAEEGSLTLSRARVLTEVLTATREPEPLGTQRRSDGRASHRAIETQTGFGHQHFRSAYSRISVRSLEKIARTLPLPESERAQRVAWVEIASIEPAGDERVYDIEVEGIHNFVANNLVVHNCVYQESYMRIARELAGFSISDADDLRKAIGKKIRTLMDSLKGKFLEGAAEQNVTPGVAKQLWEEVEKAADYSFPKAHAACYALISYQTAWLRQNHPREYMAALISSVMSTKDRVPIYVNACHELGIEVLPPDVNESQVDFAVVGGKIRFGLNAVKGVGEGAAKALIAARTEGGPFESIWDFAERVDQTVSNKRVLEALVKCGALPGSRKGNLEVLEQAVAWGQKQQADRLAGQGSIFDLGPAEDERPKHHPATPADEYEKGELLRLEKEVLGLYVSEHPLSSIRDQLRRKSDATIAELDRRRDGEVVTLGGIVSGVRHMTTKRGDAMVFLRFEDVTGTVEVVVFAATYDKVRELCTADRVLIVKGRVDRKEGETKLVALELIAFEAVPDRREVRLVIDATKAAAGTIRELAALIKDFPGESPVYADLITSQGKKVYAFGPQYKVKPAPDFYAEVKMLLGESAVA